MNVYVDTLSGDAPPEEVIEGGIQAVKESGDDIQVIFLGDRERDEKIYSKLTENKSAAIDFLHSPQRISMDDSPVSAVRNHPNSSLVKGCEKAAGEDSIFFSPGNTGAVVAASLLKLGRVDGVSRPGLAVVLPTLKNKKVVLVDVGATIDATPENLAQFAVMGRVYARHVLGSQKPTVGLLNIGEERSKGNKLTKRADGLISELDLNYVGNIEPHCLLEDPTAEVIVCEGFVGNILLKSFEGGAEGTIAFFKKAISRSLRAKLGGLLLRPALTDLKGRLSFSRYGAAPLLGVKGTILVGHGRSDARAIRNAVLNSTTLSDWSLPRAIHKEIDALGIGR